MEHTKITITIQEKKPYSGSSENGPKGDFYCESVKYTCWEQKIFDDFKVGDVVDVDYTEKSNESGGKTYTNRNISKMILTSGEVVKDDNPTPDSVESIEDLAQPGSASYPSDVETPTVATTKRITIGDLTYELTLRLVS